MTDRRNALAIAGIHNIEPHRYGVFNGHHFDISVKFRVEFREGDSLEIFVQKGVQSMFFSQGTPAYRVLGLFFFVRSGEGGDFRVFSIEKLSNEAVQRLQRHDKLWSKCDEEKACKRVQT